MAQATDLARRAPGRPLTIGTDADMGLPPAPATATAPAVQLGTDEDMGLAPKAPALAPATGPQLGTDADMGLAPAALGGLAITGRALLRGMGESAEETKATVTGQAFAEPSQTLSGLITGAPPAFPAPDPNDPVQHAIGAGLFSREGFLPNLAYGLGKSAPGIAGGLAGAAAGGVLAPEGGPIGPLVGAGIGGMLGSALPAVREAYVSARQAGLDPDAAASQAVKIAGVRGVVGGLAGAVGGLGNLFEGSFIRTADGALGLTAPTLTAGPAARALTSVPGQALITQPAIAMSGQRAEGAITGNEPTAGDLASTYVQSVIPGAAMALAHGAPGRIARAARMGTDADMGVEPAPARAGRAALQIGTDADMGVAPAAREPTSPVAPAEPGAQAPAPSSPPGTPNDGPSPPNGPLTPMPEDTSGKPPGGVSSANGAEPAMAGGERSVRGGADGTPAIAPVQPGAVPEPAARGADQAAIDAGEEAAHRAGQEEAEANAPAQAAPTEPRAETVSTATGRKVDTQFEVVERNQLRPASGDLQPRDRAGRQESEAQINDIVARFDPERLHSSPESDRGSPIIGPDNTLETGNGRTEAIRRVYADPAHSEKAQAYRNMIRRQGFDPDGYAEPVLVRRRTTELDDANRRAFVSESNTPSTLSMAPSERAAADGRGLTPDMLGKLNPDLTGGVLAAGNREFVRNWVGTLPQTERNALTTADGGLSQDGAKRLQGAILHRAYGDPATIQRMLESTDDDTRAISGALLDVSPAMASLRARIAAGDVPKALDIAPDLIRAADLIRANRDKGLAPAAILNSTDMFSPITPAVAELVRTFHDPAMKRLAGRQRIAGVLRRYVQEASKQTSSDLAGGSKLDPAEFLARARDKTPQDNAQPAQGRLIAERRPGALLAVPPRTFDPKAAMGMPSDPHHTDRPSHFARQAFHEMGFADPDAAVSKPAPVQVRALSQAVKARYGLAGIDVGKGAHPRETIDQLADAHQNMQWLAHVLAVPEAALGLGGKLRLWLGRKDAPEVTVGGQRALGVYRPDNRTIYMPGRSNSFAHEWTHALDHMLGDRLASAPNRDALMSLSPADWATAPASTSQGAFAQVMGAMFGKDSGAALRLMQTEAKAAASPPTPAMAKALADARRAFQATDFLKGAKAAGRGYLDQPYEMLARSHEAYIAQQVEAAGGSTEFLAKGDRAYLNEANSYLAASYPKGHERAAIFKAWADLHAQLRQDALYPAGQAAPKPQNDLGGLGPNHWGQLGIEPGQAATAAAGVVSRTVNKASLATRALQRVGIDHRGADPSYLAARVRAMDSLRALTFSPRGQMQAILARTPKPAQGHVQGLLDQVTTDPGSGRHVARTFEEQVHQDTRADTNAYAALVRRGDMFDLSTVEAGQLHAMLTQREDISALPERIQKAVRDNTLSRLSDADKAALDKAMLASSDIKTPTAVKHLASGIRYLLDRKHYEMRQAGLDVPYTDGYFPRWYDDHKIYAESAAFEREAARVLEIRFAREIESDPEELRTRFAQVRDALTPADATAITAAMAAAQKAAKAAGTTIQSAEGLLPDPANRDAIGRAWAAQAAAHWVERIRTGYPTEYDTRGPRGQALKARLNPAEADAILRKWLVTDPHAVIPAYMAQINRKIAYVQRFGLAGEKIDQALAAADKGGMRPEDQTAFKALLESVTGRTVRAPEGSSVARALNWIDAAGTMVLMSRVVFSALAEPMAILPRTGSLRATYEGFAQSIRDIVRTGDAKRIAEVANALGMTADSHYESVLTNRVGGPYMDSAALNTALTNYFRRVGLTGLTNSQRRGALVAAHMYLRSLAGDLLSGNKAGRKLADAQAGFRELGIGDAEQADFARWVSGFERPPNVADMEATRGGELYRGAANRFADQVNQEPKASERPALAAHPIGRMAFSLMSFQYALFANVVERFIKNTERQMHGAKGAAGKSSVLTNSVLLGVASVAAMFAANFILAAARNALFSGDAWDQHERDGNLTEWLSASALSATGLGGPLDALGQAATAVRYRRELTSLTAGAKLGFFLQAAEAVIRPFVADKPSDTNTADFNAAAGAYKLMAMPVVAAALTALPGGPLISGLAGTGIMYGTSRNAADRFAGAIFGPKGTQARDGDRVHHEDGDENDHNNLERKPTRSNTAGGPNPLYGLADDVAPAAGRILRALPVVGKAALAVGAIGYVASKVAEEADRFTGGKPPRSRGR